MKIGFSGHQHRVGIDWQWVHSSLRETLSRLPAPIYAICSLAAGADQIFARCAHEAGARLTVVIPRDDYAKFFTTAEELESYKELLTIAFERVQLHDRNNPNRSFLLAGEYIVNHADAIIVVWDGMPSRGLGGTADIAQFARLGGRPMLHINPLLHQIQGDKKWRSRFL